MPADARRADRLQEFEPQGLTVEEFLAFAETRPQEERWELIEGVPVLNPAPTKWHQTIATNICASLATQRDAIDAPWIAIIGVGAVVPASPRSLPQPDVMVLPWPLETPEAHVAHDALVLFEVLSRSNTKKDQAWRRRMYSSMPQCQHYVTVEQKKAVVVAYDRSDGWKERKMQGLDQRLELPALGDGIELPLQVIYRFTPLATPSKHKDRK